MNAIYRAAAVVGMGLAVGSWATAQTATAEPGAGKKPVAVAAEEPASGAIPVEDRATREQLARLFEVMRIREQMDSMMKMLPGMMQQQIEAQAKQMALKQQGGAAMTPEQQAAFEKLTGKYMQKALNILSVDELLDDMTAVYQRHLSRSDVEAFIAFYSSTPGQHLLNEQPALMKEFMPMVMKQTQERSKELSDELAKEMEALTKTAPAADAPTPK